MTQRAAAMLLVVLLGSTLLGALPSTATDSSPCADRFCAGAASVDMTWHTGAGQGQYGTAGNGVTADRYDPFHHQTKMVPSHGMQSRTFAKAVVVQGPDGTKAAYVKTELYLQQDILTRRVAELVSGADPAAPDLAVAGLDGTRIMLGGTHNHSAPMYASTAWGVWLFTDTLDVRMFEDTARDIARAIVTADADLRPARVGGAARPFDAVQRNILGPGTADDGTPSGFPRDHFDDQLAVVRLESVATGEPIAAIVNLGMHPESLESVDLISADFVGMVERMVERALGRVPGDADGPVVAWSQGGVGDVEPDRAGDAAPAAQRREYWHRNFAQAERMSLIVADAVLDTWDAVPADGDALTAGAGIQIPLAADAPVRMLDARFAGPTSHPLPTVSNCRTDSPGVPIVGLPDCQRDGVEQLGTTTGLLQDAGVPLPDNYGAPSFTGVQESARIHLQVLQIGEALLAACPCEPISDMTLNFKTRADAVADNLYHGYLWPCRTATAGGTECNFATAAHRPDDWRPVDADAHARMVAQITNDAAGWEDDLASLQGEVEADDPAAIYGNFTHAELGADDGFTLPLMVGQANDYVGYVVTAREYQRGDHYRKALTPFGPHTADYVNTRLLAMAAALRSGAPVTDLAPLGLVVGPADEAAGASRTRVVGTTGAAALLATETAIPDDGGTPGRVVGEPADLIERFGAAELTFEGGSNWTDNPVVTVQRQAADGVWATVATQEGGEVVLTLEYSSVAPDAALDWLTGGKVYRWTASWEVYDATAPGTYRFAVAGHHRSGGQANPYAVEGEAFTVAPWSGLAITDVEIDGGDVSFAVRGEEARTPSEQLVGPVALAAGHVRYPSTYATDNPFIAHEIDAREDWRYCFRCTYRPWAATGAVVQASVTVQRGDGVTQTFSAALDAVTGRWAASTPGLQGATVVRIDAADEYGNTTP